jgi:hypothetical protein
MILVSWSLAPRSGPCQARSTFGSAGSRCESTRSGRSRRPSHRYLPRPGGVLIFTKPQHGRVATANFARTGQMPRNSEARNSRANDGPMIKARSP